MEVGAIIFAVIILAGGVGLLIGKMCALQDTHPDDVIYQFQVNGEIRREIYRPPFGSFDPGSLRVYKRVVNEIVIDPPVRSV